jgi:hypothetical protein
MVFIHLYFLIHVNPSPTYRQSQVMVEKRRQVVDSTLGQDQVMVELTAAFSDDLWGPLSSASN